MEPKSYTRDELETFIIRGFLYIGMVQRIPTMSSDGIFTDMCYAVRRLRDFQREYTEHYGELPRNLQFKTIKGVSESSH